MKVPRAELTVVLLVALALAVANAERKINFNFAGLIPELRCPTCPEPTECPEDPFLAFARSLSAHASVLTPTSDGYDGLYTRIFSTPIDGLKLPMIIVRAATVQDVVKTVKYAKEQGLEFGVKGGTHGWNGISVPRRGLLLDLSRMNKVDVSSNTVRYEAGALCGDLDSATKPQNRAVVCGSCYSVGAGFHVHGGFGALSRLHGLAIDNLVSVDLVTADGEVVTASQTQNPDLFWAVRGALPNFGVAVAFVSNTFDVSHYYGGIVRFEASSFPSVTAWIRERANEPNLHARAILGFSSVASSGRLLTAEVALWGSDRNTTEKAEYFASLSQIPGRIDQVLGIRTYFDQQISTKASIDATKPGMKGYARAGSNQLGSDEFFSTFYQRFLALSRSPYSSAINLWGGAISDVPRNATAFWGRGIVYDWFFNAMFHDPTTNATALLAVADGTSSALAGVSGATSDVYINWLSTNQAGIVEQAYGDNLPRLRQLKALWDPENFFTNNFNIQPASER